MAGVYFSTFPVYRCRLGCYDCFFFLHQQLLVINLAVKFYLKKTMIEAKTTNCETSVAPPAFELEFSEDQKPSEVFDEVRFDVAFCFDGSKKRDLRENLWSWVMTAKRFFWTNPSQNLWCVHISCFCMRLGTWFQNNKLTMDGLPAVGPSSV